MEKITEIQSPLWKNEKFTLTGKQAIAKVMMKAKRKACVQYGTDLKVNNHISCQKLREINLSNFKNEAQKYGRY